MRSREMQVETAEKVNRKQEEGLGWARLQGVCEGKSS